MPTYQYACTSCGDQLEVVQKFTDEPLTVCPECNGHLRKVFSAVGVVFKGSGFYKTDSRAASKKAASSAKPAGSESTPAPDKPATSGESGGGSASTSGTTDSGSSGSTGSTGSAGSSGSSGDRVA
jgi:putative FmdB family regulatory protein